MSGARSPGGLRRLRSARVLPEDEEVSAIVRATIQMPPSLNMVVCAEGVETREALAFLESMGCERIQGFVIGRPIAAGDLENAALAWSGAPV